MFISFDSFSQYLYNQCGTGGNDKARGELASLVLLTIGGTGALYGLYISQQRVRAMIAGNVATRFNNAVGHLASDNPAIALGGAHSLQQIATDYKEYRRTVFDMFCSYLRVNSKQLYGKGVIDQLEQRLKEIANDKGLTYEKKWEKIKAIKKVKCPEIIKIISKNLFANDSVFTKNEGYMADLEECYFVNINLNDCVLKHTQLNNAHILNCEFEGGTMDKCAFSGATMNSCRFSGLTMDNCWFSGITMKECWFINATMSLCEFEGATMSQCNFQEAKMSQCSFVRATMDKCAFRRATMNECWFSYAQMNECSFYEAMMNECSFYGAKINGCEFNKATMNKCRFGEIITDWGFDGTRLTNCFFYKKTTFIDCDFVGKNTFTNCKGIPEEGLHGKVSISSIYEDEMENQPAIS